MPNFKEHLVISSAVTSITYLSLCKYFDRRPDLAEFLICESIGVVTGAAPDIFEPAVHPNHRAFGHSLTLGVGLARYAFLKCRNENDDWEQFQKIVVVVVVVAYLAHLLADAFTPRRLPVI